jgi:peptide/nickel transport system substrate-binding protein
MVARTARVAALVVVGVLATGGLAACAAGPADDGETSITFAVTGIAPNWDPYNGGLITFGPTMAVYEPLIEGEGVLNPRLAKEFEISEDQLSVEFTLRDDVDFVDGVHMDAAGVAEYLTALFTSPGFAFYSGVTGEYLTTVEAIDEYTLRMNFSTVFRGGEGYNFLDMIPIVSPATIGDPEAFADGPVGTGPYLVDEIVADASASFIRNPEYWNPEAYDFDEVTFLAYPDEVGALNALKTGQIDAANLTTKLIREAESAGLLVYAGWGTTTWIEFLDMDGSVVPALADVRVRQAMSMAIDRKSIGDEINLGYGHATSQLFSPGDPEYVEGGDDRYAYDPEGARELLAEAGYPDGFDMTVKVAASWGSDYHPVIQSAFADIGIRLEYDIVPDTETLTLITETWGDGTQPFSFSTMGIIPGMEYWVPGSANEWGPDPRFKESEAVANNGTDDELEAFQKVIGPMLLDQVRHIPIAVAPVFYVSQPDIAVETYRVARFAYLHQYTLAD